MSSVSELDFFILLCAEGSISNAAKALDISSAAASKRLAQIEKNHVGTLTLAGSPATQRM